MDKDKICEEKKQGERVEKRGSEGEREKERDRERETDSGHIPVGAHLG